MASSKPSAAEAARREAQSKRDRGEDTPDIVTVEVDGVTVSLDPSELDDYDALTAMDNGDVRPILGLMIPDEGERKVALDSFREESGKLRYSRVVDFVQNVFGAVGKGNSRA